MAEKLDQTDVKILKALQIDGCISNLELSQEIGLSPTPTFERVKKLEKNKIIKGYHAEVDPQQVGIGLQAFMMVTIHDTKGNAIENLNRQIADIEEIVEAYRVIGSCDYIFKIMVKDIPAYEHLAMEKIKKIKEISHTQTMVVLSTVKKSFSVPIPLSGERIK